jgi:hypothetical protein
MRNYIKHITLVLGLLPMIAVGQRINFKPFVQGEGITLTVTDNPMGLNFNQKQSIIVVGDPSPVVINLFDAPVVVFEVEAPIEFDLTLEFVWSKNLSLGGLDTGVMVPFTLHYAYNNTGEFTDMERRASAVEVPAMYHTLTLPVRRKRAGGPPMPPPTPDHEGYVRPKSKAYFYIYGTLGGVPSNARAGTYSGTIEVNVSYADNIN